MSLRSLAWKGRGKSTQQEQQQQQEEYKRAAAMERQDSGNIIMCTVHLLEDTTEIEHVIFRRVLNDTCLLVTSMLLVIGATVVIGWAITGYYEACEGQNRNNTKLCTAGHHGPPALLPLSGNVTNKAADANDTIIEI